jgi:hypothetical protein
MEACVVNEELPSVVSPSVTLLELPRELVDIIIGYLAFTPRKFLRLATVSSAWRRMACSSVKSFEGWDRQCFQINRYRKCVVTDDMILRYPNLEVFYCSAHQVTNECLKRLTNLTELRLAHNKNIESKSIAGLLKLTSLDLRYNDRIENETIAKLTNLKRLSLECNHKISIGLLSLPNLIALNLSGCSSLSGCLGDDVLVHLTNLTVLSLRINRVISDVSLSVLTNLVALDLCSNSNITDAGLRPLTNLTHLNLDKKSLISDVGICALLKLKELSWDSPT